MLDGFSNQADPQGWEATSPGAFVSLALSLPQPRCSASQQGGHPSPGLHPPLPLGLLSHPASPRGAHGLNWASGRSSAQQAQVTVPPAVGLGLWKRQDSKIQAEWPLEALRPLGERTPRSPGPDSTPLLYPRARVASWVLRMEAKGRLSLFWVLPLKPFVPTLVPFQGLSAAMFHHESVTVRGPGQLSCWRLCSLGPSGQMWEEQRPLWVQPVRGARWPRPLQGQAWG